MNIKWALNPSINELKLKWQLKTKEISMIKLFKGIAAVAAVSSFLLFTGCSSDCCGSEKCKAEKAACAKCDGACKCPKK
jgi:hypothetical protein